MRRELLFFCATGLLLVTQGCVVVPIPASKKTVVGTEIETARLQFIQPGVTAASEVTKQLGPPTVCLDDIRVYAYARESRVGYALWAIGGGGPCAGGGADGGVQTLKQFNVLLMEFDEHGRVRRFESRKRGTYQTVRNQAVAWAKAGGNAAALGLPNKFIPLSIPPGQSAIYVYRPGGWSEPGLAAVKVGLTQQTRADLRSKEYIAWVVDPGSHVAFSQNGAWVWVVTGTSCAPPEFEA